MPEFTLAQWFICLLMTEFVAASAIYFLAGDWRHGLYWFASFIIAYVVTF